MREEKKVEIRVKKGEYAKRKGRRRTCSSDTKIEKEEKNKIMKEKL